MPRIKVLYYKEEDGYIPLLEWFDTLSDKAVVKCRARMDRLKELGYELRRPIADYLRDGIYELRISLQGIQYRILYFFYNSSAVVLSHGLVKEKKVPPKQIEYAIECRKKFQKNPKKHTYEEEES